jgi:hypothetical protein
MKRFTLLNIAVVLGISAAAVLGAQSPARMPGMSDAGKAALAAQMNDAVRKGDAPAIVEIVVNREGTLYEGSAGLPQTRSSISRR